MSDHHTKQTTDTESVSLRNAIHHASVWKEVAEVNSIEIRRLKEQIARLEVENEALRAELREAT